MGLRLIHLFIFYGHLSLFIGTRVSLDNVVCRPPTDTLSTSIGQIDHRGNYSQQICYIVLDEFNSYIALYTSILLLYRFRAQLPDLIHGLSIPTGATETSSHTFIDGLSYATAQGYISLGTRLTSCFERG